MANSYSDFINYLFWKSNATGVPLSGTFELTARCNLDCKMCYIHKRANDAKVKSEELNTAQWLSLAADAQQKGMLLLLLTGGEPFLRKDFREIYFRCHELGLLVSINTNGTLITDDVIDFLRKIPPLRVNVTLYGASAETYEKLCGDAEAYERAYHAVLALKQAGIQVKLNYSATPQTLKDASTVYKFARDHDFFIQTATYMFPPVRACENSICNITRLTPEQAAQAKWEYDGYRFTEEERKLRVEQILAGEYRTEFNECQELPTEPIRCRAGSTTFWVTYNGQIRPCGMMQVPSVDLESLGFQNAWERIRKEREKIMIPAKCTSCKWKNVCEFCPAVCYAENGTFEESPDYMCQKMKSYLECAKKWYEEKI